MARPAPAVDERAGLAECEERGRKGAGEAESPREDRLAQSRQAAKRERREVIGEEGRGGVLFLGLFAAWREMNYNDIKESVLEQ